MYDHVLVPTDGSAHANRAAEHARLLARAFDATVHLLTVVDLDSAAGPFSAGGVDDEYVGRLTDRARETLDGVEPVLDGVETVQSSVVTGRPADEILASVEDNDIDLIAMGTRGRTGLARYLTGSVARRVLRLAPVPVLTARSATPEPSESYDEILVPTDGSDCAAAAFPHALAIADRFESRVHAVSVVDIGALATGTEISVPQSFRTQLTELATEATETVESAAREAGVDAVTEVRSGRTSRELLAYVTEADIDLVCMGTHGRTGLDRLLIGSTAEAVVPRADAPVITVSAGDRSEGS